MGARQEICENRVNQYVKRWKGRGMQCVVDMLGALQVIVTMNGVSREEFVNRRRGEEGGFEPVGSVTDMV